MKRLGSGRKIVGSRRTHLVEIGVEVWHPLVVELDALLRLLLHLPGPVTIQVEEVVVRPTAGPGFVVFP